LRRPDEREANAMAPAAAAIVAPPAMRGAFAFWAASATVPAPELTVSLIESVALPPFDTSDEGRELPRARRAVERFADAARDFAPREFVFAPLLADAARDLEPREFVAFAPLLADAARDFEPREFVGFAPLLADEARDFAPREFVGFAPFCGLERFVCAFVCATFSPPPETSLLNIGVPNAGRGNRARSAAERSVDHHRDSAPDGRRGDRGPRHRRVLTGDALDCRLSDGLGCLHVSSPSSWPWRCAS
jgi:hypothetical protein